MHTTVASRTADKTHECGARAIVSERKFRTTSYHQATQTPITPLKVMLAPVTVAIGSIVLQPATVHGHGSSTPTLAEFAPPSAALARAKQITSVQRQLPSASRVWQPQEGGHRHRHRHGEHPLEHGVKTHVVCDEHVVFERQAVTRQHLDPHDCMSGLS